MLFSAHANFSGPEDYTHEQTRPVVDVIWSLRPLKNMLL